MACIAMENGNILWDRTCMFLVAGLLRRIRGKCVLLDIPDSS